MAVAHESCASSEGGPKDLTDPDEDNDPLELSDEEAREISASQSPSLLSTWILGSAGEAALLLVFLRWSGRDAAASLLMDESDLTLASPKREGGCDMVVRSTNDGSRTDDGQHDRHTSSYTQHCST